MPLDVADHRRLDVGVDDDGVGPLVLPVLRVDVARQRDRHLGRDLRHELRQPLLVRGVRVGVQQRDRDRRHAGVAQLRDRGPRGVLVERDLDVAVLVDALDDLLAEAARHERHGLDPLQVVAALTIGPHDLEDVTEALGRQEPGQRSPALDQRVGAGRGPVGDVLDVAERDPGRRDALQHADGLVVDRREHLRGRDIARFVVVGEQVRERAAHIDSDSQHLNPQMDGAPPSRNPSLMDADRDGRADPRNRLRDREVLDRQAGRAREPNCPAGEDHALRRMQRPCGRRPRRRVQLNPPEPLLDVERHPPVRLVPTTDR